MFYEWTNIIFNFIISKLLKMLVNSNTLSRLQERVDINWLPDELLIKVMTNLDVDDLKSCTQVWRNVI